MSHKLNTFNQRALRNPTPKKYPTKNSKQFIFIMLQFNGLGESYHKNTTYLYPLVQASSIPCRQLCLPSYLASNDHYFSNIHLFPYLVWETKKVTSMHLIMDFKMPYSWKFKVYSYATRIHPPINKITFTQENSWLSSFLKSCKNCLEDSPLVQFSCN